MEKMTMFRITRPRIYKGTPGELDKSARQGYYVLAFDAGEAVEKLLSMYPDFKGSQLDIQVWQ